MAQCLRTAAPTILVLAGRNRQQFPGRCCETTPITHVHMLEVPEEVESSWMSARLISMSVWSNINPKRLGGMPSLTSCAYKRTFGPSFPFAILLSGRERKAGDHVQLHCDLVSRKTTSFEVTASVTAAEVDGKAAFTIASVNDSKTCCLDSSLPTSWRRAEDVESTVNFAVPQVSSCV
eukprot:14675-Heterococcus_DN1.PRE.12